MSTNFHIATLLWIIWISDSISVYYQSCKGNLDQINYKVENKLFNSFPSITIIPLFVCFIKNL